MVQGGIIDGYVIGIGTKVVAGICYSARLIVIIDDAVHTYDEQGLWTMLYESHRCSYGDLKSLRFTFPLFSMNRVKVER